MHLHVDGGSWIGDRIVEAGLGTLTPLLIPKEIARDRQKIATNRRLVDALARHPGADECVRCEVFGAGVVAGEEQREPVDVVIVPPVELVERAHALPDHTATAAKGYLRRLSLDRESKAAALGFALFSRHPQERLRGIR